MGLGTRVSALQRAVLQKDDAAVAQTQHLSQDAQVRGL
jgi:hypothetical protein